MSRATAACTSLMPSLEACDLPTASTNDLQLHMRRAFRQFPFSSSHEMVFFMAVFSARKKLLWGAPSMDDHFVGDDDSVGSAKWFCHTSNSECGCCSVIGANQKVKVYTWYVLTGGSWPAVIVCFSWPKRTME